MLKEYCDYEEMFILESRDMGVRRKGRGLLPPPPFTPGRQKYFFERK